MERLYKPSEKARAARTRALAKFKAMSFEDLIKMSEENLDSTTVEFLVASSEEQCHEVHIPHRLTKDEYIVATPSFRLNDYTAAGALAAAVIKGVCIKTFDLSANIELDCSDSGLAVA